MQQHSDAAVRHHQYYKMSTSCQRFPHHSLTHTVLNKGNLSAHNDTTVTVYIRISIDTASLLPLMHYRQQLNYHD